MNKSTEQIAFSKRMADLFLEKVAQERGQSFLSTTFDDMPNTSPIEPVVIDDHSTGMTKAEKEAVIHSYNQQGAAHVISLNKPETRDQHPIFDLDTNLKEPLGLHHRYTHPAEGHPEAVKRFGADDGTFKIYDLQDNYTKPTFREEAETHEPFTVHLDGLGTGGTVQTVILYADSTPVFGGYAFVYDIFAIAIAIHNEDPEAFQHLFLPDAITAIRPRGKGAIKILSPVLYINNFNQPHAFYRKDAGEYKTKWLDNEPLLRAKHFLDIYTEPFCPLSKFATYVENSFLLIRNRDIAHGRTAFIDGKDARDKRVLSGKWYMSSEAYKKRRLIPGTFAADNYKEIGPQFSAPYLDGTWLYDQETDINNRID